ncbi:DUF1311 domain-containing protein [Acinetobacter johnsonii]
MMKKTIFASLILSSLFLSACNRTENKAETVAEPQEMSDWSCTAPANVEQIQAHLKAEYLKALDRRLRDSREYEADEKLLTQINNGIRFEIKGISTTTEKPETAKQLDCESQLLVIFPKGLQKRAENAFLARPCEECEDGYQSTLRDVLEEGEYSLNLDNDQLQGAFSYNIIKTDKEGISLNVPNQNGVIDGVVLVTQHAVQFAAYEKANLEQQENIKQYNEQEVAQMELAQKAMNIRKKELDADQVKVVERLNQTWDNFTEEQKQQLQQDQTEWFEKRDVDCKVISQKSVYQMTDSEKETYQKQSQYWDEALRAQDQQLQYTKCFNQKTNERIVYLNNVFN